MIEYYNEDCMKGMKRYKDKHLRLKDYVIGICLRTCEIKQPCNSCGKWEEQEERDFYAC